jgi:hypothetical protein
MIEIKKILNDYSSRVTFQCFPKIFQTNSLLLQVMWTLVFFLFSMVTSGLVIKNLLEYFEYQVITQIKIVHEIPTEFPTVTICDANPFTTKEAEYLIRNVTLNEYGTGIENFTYGQFDENLGNITELMRLSISGLNETQKKALGLRKEEIWRCIYDKRPCNKTADLMWNFSYRWGNCYQFNSDKNGEIKKAKSNHYEYGLRLGITLINNNKYPLLESRGGFKICFNRLS